MSSRDFRDGRASVHVRQLDGHIEICNNWAAFGPDIPDLSQIERKMFDHSTIFFENVTQQTDVNLRAYDIFLSIDDKEGNTQKFEYERRNKEMREPVFFRHTHIFGRKKKNKVKKLIGIFLVSIYRLSRIKAFHAYFGRHRKGALLLTHAEKTNEENGRKHKRTTHNKKK